jgi:hypothetical protein
MTTLTFACCDERRRAALLGHPTLNGIDDLRVDDLVFAELDADDQARYGQLPASRRAELLWQRKLTIRFVNPLTPTQAGIGADQVRIEGGSRVRGIGLALLAPAAAGSSELALRTTAAGDFSRYTLRLIRSVTDPAPPAGIDPVLAQIDFSFKVDCPSDFDCRAAHVCLRRPAAEPAIDYLAKDYASFRRLILDRMALVAPGWRERNPADLGLALVELLAYAGDHLSYEQDAVATEAYLGTARRRTSVRRLARLVDYQMHDGAAARAWLHIEVGADTNVGPEGLRCLSGVPDLPERIVPGSPDEQAADGADVEWFQTVGADPDPRAVAPSVPLFADHNRLTFYTWGDDQCCLPAGATAATLRGSHPALTEGMVLVLEEVLGPETGDPADADPSRRQAIRLVSARVADGGGPLTDPIDGTPITEIAWHPDDALRWPFCVNSRTADNSPVVDATVARGNIVLADHGRLVGPAALGSAVNLPRPAVADPSASCASPGAACGDETSAPSTRFRPEIIDGPISMTMVVRVAERVAAGRRFRMLRFDPAGSAAAATAAGPAGARSYLLVTSELNGVTRSWGAVPDLLTSASSDLDLVVETEADGRSSLRFGDDEHGRRPEPGEAFTATYHLGNGVRGNVGPEAIRHVISADARIVRIRNPLAATGGVEPETIAEVRRRAPQAFRSQRRAVTPADYEAFVVRRTDVQRAAARIRWTGSWHTHFVAVDRVDGEAMDPTFETSLREGVEPFRLAGHDLEFDDPGFVALELGLQVCVRDEYFRADVKARLLDVLSNRWRADGSQGLFHPDRLTFGQPVFLSPILAAAHRIDGVASVAATAFGRLGATDANRAIDDALVAVGPLEIARLDNDPDWPERGVLRLEMVGGK